MLKKSNIRIDDCFSIFKENNVPVTFIVPTRTGLEKSIMDATVSVRKFLQSSNIHNFNTQEKGEANKQVLPIKYIYGDEVVESEISLYRPLTKQGDPRLWVYGLKKYAKSGDLHALVTSEEQLIIINCSRTNLKKEFSNKSSVLFLSSSYQMSNTAQELLDKLKDISKKGFIKSLKKGDTGIGYTLETLLGIKQNSSKLPDYKGIEIKSMRDRTTRNTLFSKVPDWSKSRISSAEDLVNLRGKKNNDYGSIKTIFHTIDATHANTYGLQLDIDSNFVHQVYTNGKLYQKDVCWELSSLQQRINQKHKETFWVGAETRTKGNHEEFHYNSVLHTGNPDPNVLSTLIEAGLITVDYLIWEKTKNWKDYINKNGYDFLWKMSSKNKKLLFKFSNKYSLT